MSAPGADPMEIIRRRADEDRKRHRWGCFLGVLFLVGVIWGVAYAAYAGLDSIGWIGHREQAMMTVSPNWLEGERKACFSLIVYGEVARSDGKPDGYALSHISCDDGPEHDVLVKFFGQEEQPGRAYAKWECVREQQSLLNDAAFTCLQTGTN